MESRFDKIANGIAIALISAAMLVASWNVLQREATLLDPETTVINVSHTLLDAGLREALDAVAAEYERLQAERGRQVDIRFIDIPERAYSQWSRTQLIGGTAPHVLYTDHSNTFDTYLTSRYLAPISDEVKEPNPYNEGTSLEGTPWRYTFFDGMNVSGYNFSLAEHYGVPLSATTTRVFLNRKLLVEVLGHPSNRALRERLGEDLSQTEADDLFEICRGTRRYAQETGRELVPIAGARENARELFDFLFQSATQRTRMSWDPDYDLFLRGGVVLQRLMREEIPYDNEPFRRGFALIQEFARYMQPGFFQMRRDDATFYFAQEKALMIMASSWDAASFRALVGDRFEMLIFPIPTPSPEEPYFGDYVLGRMSEAEVRPTGTFSFVNYHPEEELAVALDFMRFATSVPGNSLFSRLSGWLPSILGVEPTEKTAPFMPRLEGYPGGPSYDLNEPDLNRAVETRFHMLFSQDERETKAFYEELRALAPGLARELLIKGNRDTKRNLQQQDTMLSGSLWLFLDGHSEAEDKVAGLIDSMDGNEGRHLRLMEKLARPNEEAR